MIASLHIVSACAFECSADHTLAQQLSPSQCIGIIKNERFNRELAIVRHNKNFSFLSRSCIYTRCNRLSWLIFSSLACAPALVSILFAYDGERSIGRRTQQARPARRTAASTMYVVSPHCALHFACRSTAVAVCTVVRHGRARGAQRRRRKAEAQHSPVTQRLVTLCWHAIVADWMRTTVPALTTGRLDRVSVLRPRGLATRRSGREERTRTAAHSRLIALRLFTQTRRHVH